MTAHCTPVVLWSPLAPSSYYFSPQYHTYTGLKNWCHGTVFFRFAQFPLTKWDNLLKDNVCKVLHICSHMFPGLAWASPPTHIPHIKLPTSYKNNIWNIPSPKLKFPHWLLLLSTTNKPCPDFSFRVSHLVSPPPVWAMKAATLASAPSLYLTNHVTVIKPITSSGPFEASSTYFSSTERRLSWLFLESQMFSTFSFHYPLLFSTEERAISFSQNNDLYRYQFAWEKEE